MLCILIFIPFLVSHNVDCILNFKSNLATRKFYKQLEQIPVYYVKDQNGNIVKHVYISPSKGTVKSNLWSPRRIKNPNKLVEWDITTDYLPNSVVPFFAEEELAIAFSNSLGKETKIIKATLADYLKWSEKWTEDSCVLFPNRHALDLCTKNSTFTGTPIFITNPPILADAGTKQESYVFFQCPKNAIRTLNKLYSAEEITIDGKKLSLGSNPDVYSRVKILLGFTGMEVPGFEPKHFNKINNRLYAISIELIASLAYTQNDLANKITIIP